nr:immunoglobulin light chain junction region [Macaca mulatta]MOW56862.1 immunoglobulin light chain junction region [Macaca mulatta]MOW57421.1 immunoglobulin light chain junction region [Macaca mulatta]MOW57592.1 immunoglobulin light chain junction region [Macaca mulatta]MOW58284.1 immunoglobulin light chain junction region [Macaca mulatta]
DYYCQSYDGGNSVLF